MGAKETNNLESDQKETETKDPVSETATAVKITSETEKPKEADESKSSPPAPKPSVHKTDFEKDVVYLYQFSRTPVLPSLSPYCLKVETWLRLNGVKYENVDHKIKFRSKKGQLPFVELNGEEIADSSFIIKELATAFNKENDEWLTDQQKTLAHATYTMIEHHLLWIHFYWRFKNPDFMLKAYKLNIQHALGTKLPSGLLNFVFKTWFCRKGMKKVRIHGLGVHKPDEIQEMGKNDLKVLSDILGDKPYLFGDRISNLDIVAFSVLSLIYFADKEAVYPLRDLLIESHPNLVGLINRIKESAFPDWDEMAKTLDLNSHIPKPVKEEPAAKEKEGEGKEVDAEKKEVISDEKEPEDKEEKEDVKEKSETKVAETKK